MAKKKRKRPAVLIRFYESDLAELSQACAKRCTPRENFVRRLVLDELRRIRLGLPEPVWADPTDAQPSVPSSPPAEGRKRGVKRS